MFACKKNYSSSHSVNDVYPKLSSVLKIFRSGLIFCVFRICSILIGKDGELKKLKQKKCIWKCGTHWARAFILLSQYFLFVLLILGTLLSSIMWHWRRQTRSSPFWSESALEFSPCCGHDMVGRYSTHEHNDSFCSTAVDSDIPDTKAHSASDDVSLCLRFWQRTQFFTGQHERRPSG